jgi:hypothetical protein
LLLDLVDLVDATLVAPSGKRRLQPGIYDYRSGFGLKDPGTEG